MALTLKYYWGNYRPLNSWAVGTLITDLISPFVMQGYWRFVPVRQNSCLSSDLPVAALVQRPQHHYRIAIAPEMFVD